MYTFLKVKIITILYEHGCKLQLARDCVIGLGLNGQKIETP